MTIVFIKSTLARPDSVGRTEKPSATSQLFQYVFGRPYYNISVLYSTATLTPLKCAIILPSTAVLDSLAGTNGDFSGEISSSG
jgi:hypothetical protein